MLDTLYPRETRILSIVQPNFSDWQKLLNGLIRDAKINVLINGEAEAIKGDLKEDLAPWRIEPNAEDTARMAGIICAVKAIDQSYDDPDLLPFAPQEGDIEFHFDTMRDDQEVTETLYHFEEAYREAIKTYKIKSAYFQGVFKRPFINLLHGAFVSKELFKESDWTPYITLKLFIDILRKNRIPYITNVEQNNNLIVYPIDFPYTEPQRTQ